MTILIVKSHCEDCNKAMDFFEKNQITYEKINVSYKPLNENLLIDIDGFTKHGIKEIINLNSRYLKENKIDLNIMSRKEIIDLIVRHPEILNLPITLQYMNKELLKRVLIGFNSAEYQIVSSTIGHTEFYSNISHSYKFDDCCIGCQVRDLRTIEKSVKHE